MPKLFNKAYLLFIFILPISHSLTAQTDSIDVFINSLMQRKKIPGLQLAIVKDGKILKTGNYGFANLQDSIPVVANTVFTINSITKAFTGVAILQLVEAGKLKLSSPISSYLLNIPASWKNVTVQQLLSHNSGIPDIVDEEETVLISPHGEQASWKQVISMPMDFLPGEKFRYNQTNYLLLGKIIDSLSGMPFTRFILTEQLQKVGMARTIQSGFDAPKAIIPHTAGGYQFQKGKLVNMFFSFPPSLQTAAGMSSTATEMAHWIIALQNGSLLKQKTSLDALWAPALVGNGKTAGFNSLLNGYAAGWPVAIRPQHPALAPVGGGRSALFVYPEDNLSVIVLTNLSGSSPEGFIDEIAGFYIPSLKEANGFGLSPSQKTLWQLLVKSGYKNAIPATKKLQVENKGFILSEKDINSWGYKLLQQQRMKDALEIFRLNVWLYPRSSNAFDSLGEIFAELGEKAEAIKNYEVALKLDPGNRNAELQLKTLKAN